ncbi:unnamed protein product, partial [Rotaria sp. Silwood1]
MDEGNIDFIKKLLFDNVLGSIESSPHTDKQRRWRAKKKDQHHRTQLSLHHLLVEQICQDTMVEFFTFLSNLSTIENFHHEFLSIDDLTPGCHLQVDAIFQISRLLFNIDIQ